MQKKIIFVHQPKTGGANFAKILKNSYGKKNVYRDKDRAKERLNEHLRSEGKEVVEHTDPFYDRLKYNVIFGHFSPLKYKERFPNAIYLTFFRDPIQRIISHYHYWQRTEITDIRSVNPLRLIFMEQNLSLKDFAIMIKEDRIKENHLELFKVANFDFVGIMEYYDRSLMLIKEKVLPDLRYFDHDTFNSNPEKSVKDQYEVEDKIFFEELFKEELEQYHLALTHFKNALGAANFTIPTD